MAVRPAFSSLSVLKSLKSMGYTVGKLKWKSPKEHRSIVFNQSGFDVDHNTGQTEHATLWLSNSEQWNSIITDHYPRMAQSKRSVSRKKFWEVGRIHRRRPRPGIPSETTS